MKGASVKSIGSIGSIDFYNQRTSRNSFWVGGREGQEKIKNLKVAIAGLGGMGSNIAEILVRLGVGYLKIADPDTIDVSNINRQVIANTETIGRKKARASYEELKKIGGDVKIVTFEEGITQDNAEEFVSDVDIVIDEIDVFPLAAHVLLHRAAQKRGLPVYMSFVVGLGIHLYKFDSKASSYTIEDFLLNNGKMIENPTAEFLIERFGHPLPGYMCEHHSLNGFVQKIKDGQVPIFGASTYLGQSLLCIRALHDAGCLSLDQKIPLTPIMPSFLVLDPLELKIFEARMDEDGEVKLGPAA